MKRAFSVIMVFLSAAMGFGLTPSATAHEGGEHITVISRGISEKNVDVGAKGPSAGDYFIFTERLMKRGQRVGTDSGRCDLIRATQRVYSIHCMVTLTLNGRGQLTVQGRITFRRGSNDDPVLAITGGTGEFTGASGEFILDDGPGPTRFNMHLAE